ncbi:MAG: hypothetical protein IPI34_03065 [bacterium]|nr:hypothetical protein [bacterium]
MKKVFLLSVLMLALAAGNAAAAIGWGGNVWPNSGAIVVPTGPVNVYAQCWKGGVTDAGGQGAGIEAFCDMSADGGAVTTVQMTFQGDVGSNDEYTTQVPQGMLMGASYVDVHVKFHDLTDDTWYTDVKDQANNSPPQRYNVTNVLPVDVNVTFTLCMSGEATAGDPCVIGSSNWEGVANRIVTLPTDGTTSVVLGTDSWNNLPIGCGVGETPDRRAHGLPAGVPRRRRQHRRRLRHRLGAPALELGRRRAGRPGRPGPVPDLHRLPGRDGDPAGGRVQVQEGRLRHVGERGQPHLRRRQRHALRADVDVQLGRQHLGRLLPRRQRECGLGFGEVAVPVGRRDPTESVQEAPPRPRPGRRFAGQAWRPRRARISLEISSIGLPVTSTTAQPGLRA